MKQHKDCEIDKILYLIDWTRSQKEQEEGIAMARNVTSLKAFFLPYVAGSGKGTWENCAMILCQRTDEELEPHIGDMLRWLEDLNWPGAERIQERLVAFQRVERLAIELNIMVPDLVKLKKWSWVFFLYPLLSNLQLKSLLKQDTIEMLEKAHQRILGSALA